MSDVKVFAEGRIWLPIGMVFSLLVLMAEFPMLAVPILGLAVVGLTFSKYGDVAIFSLILPVTVFSAFLDVKLSNIPLLDSVRSAYLYTFVVLYFILGIFDLNLFRIYRITNGFLIFVLTIVVLTPFSIDVGKSILFFIKTWFVVVVVFLAGVNILKSQGRRRAFEVTVMLLLALTLIFSFYQSLTQSLGPGTGLRNPDLVDLHTGFEYIKATSFFATSYAAGEFYILVLPFLLLKLYCASGVNRVLYLASVGAVLIGVASTQQRSALAISFLEVIGMYWLVYGRLTVLDVVRKLIFIIGTFAIIAFVLFSTDFGQALITRSINSIAAPDQVDDMGSSLVRLNRILIAWDIFLSYPIAGAGLGMSSTVYPAFGWIWENYDGGAHNVYLHLLCELGGLGFIAFCIYIVSFLRMALKRLFQRAHFVNLRAMYASAVIFIFALLLDGLFSGLFGFPSILLIAIGLAYIYSAWLMTDE